MPELGPKNLPSILSLKQDLETNRSPRGFIEWGKLRKLVEDYNEEYVGHGAEAVVVRDRGNPDSSKLLAFYYKDATAERAKMIFYLQRVLSTLFPHNFPHFYASFGKDSRSQGEGISGNIRQEVDYLPHDPFTEIISARYPFSQVDKSLDKLGIKISFDRIANFVQGIDGGEYYVDTVANSNIRDWSLDKILDYMRKNNYSNEDIDIVRRSIKRLKSIYG